MRIRSLLLLAATLSAGLLSKAARADSLSSTLSNPSQGVNQAGGVLTFSGTILAPSTNTGNEYLNGDNFNLTSGAFDDSDFLNNAPQFLAPGQSFTGALFTVTELANSADGVFLGTFSILGGSTTSSYTALATDPFAITVTPEPSTWLLLGTGAFGIAVRVRRRSVLLSGSPLG